MEDVETWIKRCEGLSLKPYLDTVKKITIGYGRNIQDNGISEEEAKFLFKNDLQRCIHDLNQHKVLEGHNIHAQAALINMCFNMGINRLLGFKKMLAAWRIKDYLTVAAEALNSKWAIQVPLRAQEVYNRFVLAHNEA